MMSSIRLKIKDNKILEYSNQHNHQIKTTTIIKEEFKKNIQKEIKNSHDPFFIKLTKLYKSHSADKEIKEPAFDSIKSGLYKNINSKLPKEVENFEDMPDDSIYYKTISNDDFLYYKNNNVVIFQ